MIEDARPQFERLADELAGKCAGDILDRCEFAPLRTLALTRLIIEEEIVRSMTPYLAALDRVDRDMQLLARRLAAIAEEDKHRRADTTVLRDWLTAGGVKQ
jgi:hypothetical protein